MGKLSKSTKALFRRIIPSVLLKRIFLIVNKTKILTVDKVLFPEYKIPKSSFRIYRNGFPFREAEISLDDLPDDEVKQYMQSWRDWTQEEFLLILDQPCWIEPDYGWAIIEPNNLVYYSLGVSRTWFQRKPAFFRFMFKKQVMQIPKAISLRDTGEENYFHFYNDVLSKLFFLQLNDINITEIPIIISRKLWDKAYFKFYFEKSPVLKSLIWIVQQDDQYIQCNSTIFCKALTHRKDIWNKIFSPFNSSFNSGNRKLFLTRRKERLRFIENMTEIEELASRFGFKIIDTDSLSPQEQLTIFAETKFLVGIHGAGMTNMAFRNKSCCILELFPPPDLGYLPYHYIMLAKMSGFHYRGLIGEPGRVHFSGGFYVSAEKLKKSLVEMGINSVEM